MLLDRIESFVVEALEEDGDVGRGLFEGTLAGTRGGKRGGEEENAHLLRAEASAPATKRSATMRLCPPQLAPVEERRTRGWRKWREEACHGGQCCRASLLACR